MKVFLGGTCSGSKWRDEIIPVLDIDYFNPVVDTWDEQAYQRELHERVVCDVCLYVLTPRSEGYYSIAEVIDDSNKRPEATIFCFKMEDDGLSFSEHQRKSLHKIGLMVRENGGTYVEDFAELKRLLNVEISDIDADRSPGSSSLR